MSAVRTTARRRTGFTLIELMITAAIVGVLAAIAIPNFLRYQLRTRATETLTHMKGIAISEIAYYSEKGTYRSVSSPVPAALPGQARLPWPNNTPFDDIGWAPEGGVVFQYAVRFRGSPSRPPRTSITTASRPTSRCSGHWPDSADSRARFRAPPASQRVSMGRGARTC